MRASSARNTVRPFYESDSWIRRCWQRESRGWKRERRGVWPRIFVHSRTKPKKCGGSRAEWRWRVINGRDSIWGQSTFLSSPLLSHSLSCPCVYLFVVPRQSFAFSCAFATCVEREVISCPPRDPCPIFFYYSMTRTRESTEVSTITSCSRRHSYVTMAVAGMSEEPFSFPKNIARSYTNCRIVTIYITKWVLWGSWSEFRLRPNIMITHAAIDCYLYIDA